MMTLTQRFRASLKGVRKAGVELLSRFRNKETGPIRFKRAGEDDPVTKDDVAIETILAEYLLDLDPEAQLLGEEGGMRGSTGAGRRWILDPLDGTVNYIHGKLHFAISLAYEVDGILQFGIVHHPTRRECFWAVRGKGAFLNGKPIRVSRTDRLTYSLVSTGFNSNIMDRLDISLGIFKAFLLATMGVRRSGSAALDLCYLAAGRLDGFYEEALSPWDIAAGVVILEEAGGRWTDYSGRPVSIYNKELLASNGLLHGHLMETIRWGRELYRRGGEGS